MGEKISKIYFYSAIVDHKPGEVGNLLRICREHNVNLLNRMAYPIEKNKARIDLFPEYGEKLKHVAEDAGVTLAGPQKAFIVRGTDRPGVMIEYHLKLTDAGINVSSVNGTSCGDRGFGYIIQVNSEDFDTAANALGLANNHSSMLID